MDNEKRVLLAIVLSIAVLFIYQSLFAPPEPGRGQKPGTNQEQQAPVLQAPPPKAKQEIPVPRPPQQPPVAASSPAREIAFATDLYTAVLSSRGATLKSFRLHNYKDKLAPPAAARLMKKIFSSGSGSPLSSAEDAFKQLIHVPDSDPLPLRTSFIDPDGNVADTARWTLPADTMLPENGRAPESLTFYGSPQHGITMQKQFVFHQQRYRIDVTLTLRNTSPELREVNPFIEWTAQCPPKKGGGFLGRGTGSNQPRFSYFIKDSVEKKEASKVTEPITIEGDILWTAIEEKYFTSVIVPQETRPAQVRLIKPQESLLAYQCIYPRISLGPGDEISYSFFLYLGPKDIDILRHQEARLEKTIDFGWFDIIAKPLLLALNFFYGFIGNYGLAIILITIIIKIIFWPLTHKSFTSMKDMQKVQPEIAKLKEKYKDNKEAFAREQMALYKKYKVNPLGGCLPMVLQIPVFIALYRVLMDSIELRHATFIPFWINDLSAKDPTYIAPVIMGLSMLLQQKMTPTTGDPSQAKMMMFMPVIFTVMFLNFPSGLVIYWLVNNVLSIAQQLYINKKSHDAGGAGCSPSKSKPKPSKKRSQ